jgi:hypothetical protein
LAKKEFIYELNSEFDKTYKHFFKVLSQSLMNYETVFIITKDLFYCIEIENENIPSFIVNNNNSVIETMIIKDLCYKPIIDPNIVSHVMVINITFIMTSIME